MNLDHNLHKNNIIRSSRKKILSRYTILIYIIYNSIKRNRESRGPHHSAATSSFYILPFPRTILLLPHSLNPSQKVDNNDTNTLLNFLHFHPFH